MPIRIPHSSPSRREKSYAKLILRVSRSIPVFEGTFFRTGSLVDETKLRPTEEYPETPLLIEFAGTDGTKARDSTGCGHRRLSSIHILWRFDRDQKTWEELARVRSYGGGEWFHHMAPIVKRELAAYRRPANAAEDAAKASSRVLAVLDNELDRLDRDGRSRAISMLYDQVTARLVLESEDQAA